MGREAMIAALAAAGLAVAQLAITHGALAQGYPERTADMLGRVLADSFTQQLGQRFIVVNKAAAAGVVGTAAVAHARPDGYTLLHGAAVSLTVMPLTDMQAGYTHKSFE